MSDGKIQLSKPEFPRSNTYDPHWILDNQMGPNPLWLAEWLSDAIPFKPGMRVLDLGCGKAITSIFLAKEFDVQVWAADLWISPESNYKRIQEASAESLVYPLRAEAHALPFSEAFFDAVIAVDSYQYFGTDVLYLGYLSRFIAPGGYIGIAVPGLTSPITDVPEHLSAPQSNGKVFWEEECWCFNTANWWLTHWSRSSSVANIKTDTMKDGWRHWADFEKALASRGTSVFPSDAEALEKDQGRYIGFIRAIGNRTNYTAENLYNPDLGREAGVDM